MGLYYKLSNGEDIEIRITENEDFESVADILLFGGSTVISYPLSKTIMLNEVIEHVEKEYNNLLESNMEFEQKCWCD